MAEARRLALACCKLYVSDSRSSAALESLHGCAAAHIVHSFTDTEYNRVGFTLVGGFQSWRPFQAAVVKMVQVALERIDLRVHCGSHPRLGVVDHVCFHPLGRASLSDVAAVAGGVAAEIGSELGVPAFLYGACHREGRKLADLRRSLGYFRAVRGGKWEGNLPAPTAEVAPDFGPRFSSSETGVVVVGACPWVTNYNVPISSTDLKAAARIARGVSERGGGLAKVEAMALLHGEGCIEIACNLLDTGITDCQAVQDRVAELALKQDTEVLQGYTTGQSEQEVLELACQKLVMA